MACPYGYRIVNGRAEIDTITASRVREFYALYLDGLPIEKACVRAGVEREPHSAGKLLSDQTYLGTEFYPRIIEPAVFDAVQAERKKRNRRKPGQHQWQIEAGIPETRFRMKAMRYIPVEPAEMAMALYENIECAPNGEQKMTDAEQQKLMMIAFGGNSTADQYPNVFEQLLSLLNQSVSRPMPTTKVFSD